MVLNFAAFGAAVKNSHLVVNRKSYVFQKNLIFFYRGKSIRPSNYKIPVADIRNIPSFKDVIP